MATATAGGWPSLTSYLLHSLGAAWGTDDPESNLHAETMYLACDALILDEEGRAARGLPFVTAPR